MAQHTRRLRTSTLRSVRMRWSQNRSVWSFLNARREPLPSPRPQSPDRPRHHPRPIPTGRGLLAASSLRAAAADGVESTPVRRRGTVPVSAEPGLLGTSWASDPRGELQAGRRVRRPPRPPAAPSARPRLARRPPAFSRSDSRSSRSSGTSRSTTAAFAGFLRFTIDEKPKYIPALHRTCLRYARTISALPP